MAKGDNLVILLGNLGQDPDVQYTASGICYAKFSMATSESWKDSNDEWQEETQWHRCIAWGKLAEGLGQRLTKGMTVQLQGKIKYGSYEKDGVKHYTTDIVANSVRPIKPKGSGRTSDEEPYLAPPNNSDQEEDFPF